MDKEQQEVANAFEGTPCYQEVLNSIDCYNSNSNLSNCDNEFMAVHVCVENNNLEDVLDNATK